MRRSTIILAVVLALSFSYFSYEIIFIFPKLGSIQAVFLNTFLISAEILCSIFSIYLLHSIFCTIEWKHFNHKGLKKKPFVSVQIPTFNEPLRVLRETILSCLNQEYPKNKYEILVADDSTDIKKMNKIKDFCKEHKIKFIHRDNRNGFKAGALNNLNKYAKGDVIAVLDADDKPEPTFLSHAVETLLSDEKIAFVQTRNAERNFATNTVTGIGRMIRDLFFGAIMKSKDMRSLAIFCGSGGVVKRKLLDEVGGWPEETVTEDIDLTTKLFASGYISKYINPVECKGLLPCTFTGLTGQVFRWAFGTTKTFKLRWREAMRIPGFFRKIEHFLSLSTYLLGPAMVLIDIVMIAHLLLRIQIFHMIEPMFLWIFGVGFTLSSFIALLFVQVRDDDVSMKRIFTYIFVMYGMAWNFTKAAFAALFGRSFTFFRTPRGASRKSLKVIAKKYWVETVIGMVSVYAALTSIADPVYSMQSIWVFVFGIGFLSVPVLAVKYR